MLKPLTPWVGGKYKLREFLMSKLPESYGTYYEPFLGAGGLLYALQPNKAVCGDCNNHVIDIDKTVQRNAKALVNTLKKLPSPCRKNYDLLKSSFKSLPKTMKVAVMIYLLKYGFGAFGGVTVRVSQICRLHQTPNIMHCLMKRTSSVFHST